MGVRILDSECASTEKGAVLFDSVSGFAFGPVLADHDEAEAFRTYAEEQHQGDIRNLTDAELEDAHRGFVASREQDGDRDMESRFEARDLADDHAESN